MLLNSPKSKARKEVNSICHEERQIKIIQEKNAEKICSNAKRICRQMKT